MVFLSYINIFGAVLMVLVLESSWSAGNDITNETLNYFNKETETFTNCQYNDYKCNITRILERVLIDYDKRLRPYINEQKPVTIICGIWILSIDSINAMDMDYRIDLFLRQTWRDPRLATSYPETLTVSNTMLEKIWIPDTYFENSKHSNYHSVTVANKMLRIQTDGTIEYNARISVRASCPMDLRLFPVDKQTCSLLIDSYGYSNKHLLYGWEDTDTRISLDDKVKELPQYNLTTYETLSVTRRFVAGNWSGLKFIFTLERRCEHFILHLYAPCAMIVTLSWISFFIDKSVIPARIALGITSILTTTTILNIQNNSMPKVSYIKLADWYLIISFLFVFAVLLEYTVVLYLAEQDRLRQKMKEYQKVYQRKKILEEEKKNLKGYGCEPSEISLLRKKYEGEEIEESDDEPVDNPYHKYRSFFGNIRVDVIDEYSRIAFPLSFVMFNVFYWIYFFDQKNKH